jgi:hypothetical protein
LLWLEDLPQERRQVSNILYRSGKAKQDKGEDKLWGIREHHLIAWSNSREHGPLLRIQWVKIWVYNTACTYDVAPDTIVAHCLK